MYSFSACRESSDLANILFYWPVIVCKSLAYFLYRGHRERKSPIVNTPEGTRNVSLCHDLNNCVIIYYSEVLLQSLREFWQFLVYLINIYSITSFLERLIKNFGLYQCVSVIQGMRLRRVYLLFFSWRSNNSVLCLTWLLTHYLPHRFGHNWRIFRHVRKIAKSDCKLRHVCLSESPSVRPSAWNNPADIRRILMKFGIWVFFENLPRKFKCH